jgi:hypothetical protein
MTNAKRLSGTNVTQGFREYTADSDKQVMKPCSGFDNAYAKQNTTLLKFLEDNGRGNMLHRGHLVPAADAVFLSWKKTTYLFANAAPEWQVVNRQGGNWGILENKVRDFADGLSPNSRLEIITGVFDHLELRFANGTERPVYLKIGHQIPVPKYFYKIVLNHQAKEGIAFVVQQNIFKDEKFGQGIGIACPAGAWYDDKFGKSALGKLTCLPVKDLWRILHPKNANRFDNYDVLVRNSGSTNSKKRPRPY